MNKQQTLIKALKRIAYPKPYPEESEFHLNHEIAQDALKQFEDMPDEICGNCIYNNKKCSCKRSNCCHNSGKGLKIITANDYCSRWRSK